jgi:hemin uptake protein HemP
MRLQTRTILNIMPQMNPPCKPRAPPVGAPPAPAAGERIVDSRELLGPGDGGVLIRHEGRIYRLKRTRQGKLILTA